MGFSRLFDYYRSRVVFSLLAALFFIILFCTFCPTSAKAQGTGTLSVTTTPVNGAIYIDMLLKGRKLWSGVLDAGNHVVTFGDVEGYITPAPQPVTVIEDETYGVIGFYRKLPSD
jgi:hypothetical protein